MIVLASYCGYGYGATYQILEKAIILLKWGVEVSCKDSEGDTVLHKALNSDRERPMYHSRSKNEPGELLKVFIAAGADIYALNNRGYSASRTARKYGRKREWLEALEFCGFDSKEVMNQTISKYKQYPGRRQTSKLTFQEYYQTWDEKMWDEKMTKLEEAYMSKDGDSGDEYAEEEYRESDDSEVGYSEEKESENEERQEIQNTQYFTPLATKLASRYTNGDSNDQTKDLVDDYYDLGQASQSKHGNETRGEMLRVQTDHLSAIGPNTQFTSEGTNYDCNDAPRPASGHLYDPILNDEAASPTFSWEFGRMDDQRNLDQANLVEGELSEAIRAALGDHFQTEFDAFMTSD